MQLLEKKYDSETNAKAKIRLQCAVLRKKGKSLGFIAGVVGKRESTISDILKRFEERGVGGCHAIKQKGQPKKLSPIQTVRLKKILSKNPVEENLPYVVWTTKLVQYIIRKKFGIEYVIMQVHRILDSFGLSLQKARPEHLKANKKLQKEFKKNFDGESKSLENLDMRSYFWTKPPSS